MRILHIVMDRAHEVYHNNILFSAKDCLYKAIPTFYLNHRCYPGMHLSVYVSELRDANYRLVSLPDDGATRGLLVEHSEGWLGECVVCSLLVFRIMSVLVTAQVVK